MLLAQPADQVVGLGCPVGAGGQFAHPAEAAGRLPGSRGRTRRAGRRQRGPATPEARGIGVRAARKGIESSRRLGRHRWIIESCLSWQQHKRRLVRRYEREPDHVEAFADLG